MDKKLIFQASLYVVPAVLSPWLVLVAGSGAITWRSIAAASLASIIAGYAALKAFLSTTYAASPVSGFRATHG